MQCVNSAQFEINLPAHNITGHGDALIRTDYGWWVVEVKSIKKAGIRMGIPKKGHVQQGTTYAWAVRDYGCFATDALGNMVAKPPLGDSLKGLIVVYVEKEDLQIIEYTLPWNDSWRGAVKEQLVELEMYRADPESLPPRLPKGPRGRRHWMCGYCAFTTKCYAIDPDEIPPTVEGDF